MASKRKVYVVGVGMTKVTKYYFLLTYVMPLYYNDSSLKSQGDVMTLIIQIWLKKQVCHSLTLAYSAMTLFCRNKSSK